MAMDGSAEYICWFLSGDGRFWHDQHADGPAKLVSGTPAVFLLNGGSRNPTAGAPNSSKSHWQAWQRTQVLKREVRPQDKRVLNRNLSALDQPCLRILLFCGYSIIADISVLKLKVDKCSRQDNLFMKKVFIFLFTVCVHLVVAPLFLLPLLCDVAAWAAALPSHLPGL